jgi:hypothetical protein
VCVCVCVHKNECICGTGFMLLEERDEHCVYMLR